MMLDAVLIYPPIRIASWDIGIVAQNHPGTCSQTALIYGMHEMPRQKTQEKKKRYESCVFIMLLLRDY